MSIILIYKFLNLEYTTRIQQEDQVEADEATKDHANSNTRDLKFVSKKKKGFGDYAAVYNKWALSLGLAK